MTQAELEEARAQNHAFSRIVESIARTPMSPPRADAGDIFTAEQWAIVYGLAIQDARTEQQARELWRVA